LVNSYNLLVILVDQGFFAAHEVAVTLSEDLREYHVFEHGLGFGVSTESVAEEGLLEFLLGSLPLALAHKHFATTLFQNTFGAGIVHD